MINKNNLKANKYSLRQININFISYEDNIFFKKENITTCFPSIFEIMSCNLNVNHIQSQEVADKIVQNKNFKTNGELIVINRNFDKLTPLVHFFQFQAIAHDYKILENNIFNFENKKTVMTEYEIYDGI